MLRPGGAEAIQAWRAVRAEPKRIPRQPQLTRDGGKPARVIDLEMRTRVPGTCRSGTNLLCSKLTVCRIRPIDQSPNRPDQPQGRGIFRWNCAAVGNSPFCNTVSCAHFRVAF